VPAIQSRKPRGVAIDLDRVDVHAAGTHILKAIQLCIEPGSHVAVVGESGSGKSTLLGLLLGFYRATTGSVCVDGRALDEPNLTVLRAVTAWVDPAVHLWNESLIDNLYYGHNPAMVASLASLVDQAELQSLLENLPEGAQTTLGEGGGLVSGGEGQRVRFGRAFLRTDARLVLLDEPFRGLDRGQRASLLRRARAQWEDRTLVCVTHDIRETLAFDRVLVIADGRICEDGAPTDLYSKPLSRYRQLLESERSAEHLLWSTDNFRRVTLVDGRLQPDTSDESAEVEAVSIGCQRQPAGAEQKS
jgi:ATP-binding cassette subfamily B protein